MAFIGQKLSIIVIAVVSSLFGLSWAISSPPGSASDEIYHLGSVWCAWGENEICKFDGEPLANGRRNITLTPEFSKAGCFRSDIDKINKSAKCYLDNTFQNERFAWEMNSGNYPGLTYTILRFFATNNVDLSVIIMRLFNYSLLTFLIILAFFALSFKTFYSSMLAIFLTLVPVSIFFLASINPNSWTIIGLGFYWAFLWDLFDTANKNPNKLIYIGLFFSSIISIGSRSDASIYITIINFIMLFYLIVSKTLRNQVRNIILIFFINTWAIIQFMFNQQFEAESASVNNQSDLNLILQNFKTLPIYFYGIFGGQGPKEWPFGLGWFDTPLPKIVPIVVFGNLILTCLMLVRIEHLKQKFFAYTLPFFIIAIPLIILQLRGSLAIYFLQPRYLLPLLIVFIGILIINFDKFKYLNFLIYFNIFALSFANSISLHTNIKRYTIGLDSKNNFYELVEWWWDIPISPFFVWMVGTLFLPILMYLVLLKLQVKKIHA